MKHGEAYYALVSRDDFFKLSISKIGLLMSHLPKPMQRDEAIKYYTVKLRNYWDSKLTIKDFDKVEHYYDFYECKKLLKRIFK